MTHYVVLSWGCGNMHIYILSHLVLQTLAHWFIYAHALLQSRYYIAAFKIHLILHSKS